MTTQPTSRAAADRAASDPAPLVPTTAAAAGSDNVTAREIAEFLHDLARIRSTALGADRAALPARKADLFTRIADQRSHTATTPPASTPPPTPEGRTP